MAQTLDASVKLRLDRGTFDALLASAAADERTVSAEVRLALRRWLASRVATAAPATVGESS